MPKFTILLFLFLLPFTTADIKNIKITSDSRPMILLEDFGFTESGHISVSVKSATFTSTHNTSRLAFCILPIRISTLEKKSQCLMDNNHSHTLLDFTQLIPPQNSFHQSYQLTLPNKYYLYFANCQPNSHVTMSIATEAYNLNGGSKVYLPVGQTQLPVLYLVYATAHFLFLLVWVYVCVVASNKTHLFTHLLMGGLILTKVLSLISAAVDKQHVKFTGTSHGWDLVFFITQLSRVTLLCTVIALIGISWSKSKTLVVQMNMMVVFVYVLLVHNLAMSLEFIPFMKSWYQQVDVFTVSFHGCFIVLVIQIPMWCFSHKIFEPQGNDPKSCEAKRTLEYIVILSFMVSSWWLTLSFVMLLKVVLAFYAYKHQWVGNAVEETVTLSVYMLGFFIFRPLIQMNILCAGDDVLDKEFELNVTSLQLSDKAIPF